jgi:hypothetical protein
LVLRLNGQIQLKGFAAEGCSNILKILLKRVREMLKGKSGRRTNGFIEISTKK